MSAPPREERIRLIKNSLVEWCADSHDAFSAKAQARVDKLPPSKIPEDIDLSDLAKYPVLPKQVIDAIHFVITKEIQNVQEDMENGETFTLATDRLDHHYAPMKVHFHLDSSNQQARKSTVVPKFEFREMFRTNPKALSPFRRFTYQEFKSAPAYFAALWQSVPACFEGNVWEAVVSHWMEYSGTKCFHCESKSCLRWIGGRKGLAWGDVVCIECKSLYEIKSKATMDKVHQCLFNYQQVPSGSFLNFARHRGLGKKYLVIVSRQPGENNNHPIYGLEIETVAPTLTDLSFHLERKNMYLGSILSVNVKRTTSFVKGILCPLPTDASISIVRVYDEHFGEGEWSRQISAMEDLSSQFKSLQLSDSRLSIKKNMAGHHVTRHTARQGASTRTPRRQTKSRFDDDEYDGDIYEKVLSKIPSKQRFKLDDDIQYSSAYKGLIPSRKCKKWYNR